jgi:hypothetical protein
MWFDDCFYFTIISPRYEAVDDNFLGGLLYGSTIIPGFVLGGVNSIDPTKIHLSNQSRYNVFIGQYGADVSTLIVDSTHGGFGFRNYNGDSSLLGQLTRHLS